MYQVTPRIPAQFDPTLIAGGYVRVRRLSAHAGAKLHVVESVSTGLPTQFSITDGRTHESTQLSTGRWLSGSLLLYYQGYFDYRTMELIDANDGWFVTRLKPNAKPRIVEELRDWRGNAISQSGKQLHDVLNDLHRDASHHLLIEARWSNPDRDEEHIDWTREFHEAMQPYTTDDVAMNFLTEDESEERIRASYGANYSRLAELKREWDPENLFSMNQNIDPSE